MVARLGLIDNLHSLNTSMQHHSILDASSAETLKKNAQPTPELLVHNPTLHACKGLAVQALCTVSPVHTGCCTVPVSCLQRQPAATDFSQQTARPLRSVCTEGFKLPVPGKVRAL